MSRLAWVNTVATYMGYAHANAKAKTCCADTIIVHRGCRWLCQAWRRSWQWWIGVTLESLSPLAKLDMTKLTMLLTTYWSHPRMWWATPYSQTWVKWWGFNLKAHNKHCCSRICICSTCPGALCLTSLPAAHIMTEAMQCDACHSSGMCAWIAHWPCCNPIHYKYFWINWQFWWIIVRKTVCNPWCHYARSRCEASSVCAWCRWTRQSDKAKPSSWSTLCWRMYLLLPVSWASGMGRRGLPTCSKHCGWPVAGHPDPKPSIITLIWAQRPLNINYISMLIAYTCRS